MLASNGQIHRYFPSHNRDKTHCVNGHEFTAENTRHKIVKGRPRRQCKACEREAARDYYLFKVKPRRKQEAGMKCPHCDGDALERGGVVLTLTECRVWDAMMRGKLPPRMTYDSVKVHIARIRKKLPPGWRITPVRGSQTYTVRRPT